MNPNDIFSERKDPLMDVIRELETVKANLEMAQDTCGMLRERLTRRDAEIKRFKAAVRGDATENRPDDCPNRAVLFIHEPGNLSPGEIIRVVDWIETQTEALLAGQTGDGVCYVAKLRREEGK